MPSKDPIKDMRIEDLIEDRARSDGAYAIAYALLEQAEALKACASALRDIGIGNAATPMGGLELLAMEVRDGLAAIAAATREGD